MLGWSPTWFASADAQLQSSLLGLYRAIDRPMEVNYIRGLRADALAKAAGPANDDGISQARKAFRGAARLMRGDAGPRVAVLAVDGFDTHSEQGGLTGELNDRLAELDAGLADFKTEIGAIWANTIVMCVTEFGRTAAINGDKGTDHGVGTVALLAGGAVAGGRVVTSWPGLAPADLYEASDLKPTIDLRSVFKGVLKAHLGVPAIMLSTTIFPDSAGVTALTSLVKVPVVAPAPVADAPVATTSVRAPSPLEAYRAGKG